MASKRSKSAAQRAGETRQREIIRDEALQRDQNVSLDATRKAEARAREDRMVNAQRGMNDQEAQRVKEGDYVKVDLDAVPENVKSINLPRYKHLQSVGAHGLAGRVVGIEHLPEGRHLTVDSATHTLKVPEAALVRIDLHAKKSKAKGRKRARSRSKKSGAKRAAR